MVGSEESHSRKLISLTLKVKAGSIVRLRIDTIKVDCRKVYSIRALSSAGRAIALHAIGHRFDPCSAHVGFRGHMPVPRWVDYHTNTQRSNYD